MFKHQTFKQFRGARGDDRKCWNMFKPMFKHVFKKNLESGDRNHIWPGGGFPGTSPTKPAPSTGTRRRATVFKRLGQRVKRSRVKGQTRFIGTYRHQRYKKKPKQKKPRNQAKKPKTKTWQKSQKLPYCLLRQMWMFDNVWMFKYSATLVTFGP